MRILGIDPGLATIGLGVVDTDASHDPKAIDWLTITTPAHTPLSNRLQEIAEDLAAFLEETKPDIAVVERLFFAVNERTAIDVAQARGTILLTLARRKIPVMEPTPLELKSAITGDGKADKKQMQDMIQRILNLNECPHPDDAADALALAVYGALHGQRVLEDISAA